MPLNFQETKIIFSFQKAAKSLVHGGFSLVSSTDVLIYVDVISNKHSSFSSQIHTPSFSINCPSLVSTARSLIILWRLWSHKPSHKHDSNKYQSNAFVICDHQSDETRSVTHENKAYLVWSMFRFRSCVRGRTQFFKNVVFAGKRWSLLNTERNSQWTISLANIDTCLT